MALSATPRLIKRKQIHGAPGGGKNYSGWTAGGTLGKPREPKINVLVLRCGSSWLPGWLIPCVEESSVSSLACSILPLSLSRFFLPPLLYRCPSWGSWNASNRLESLIRWGNQKCTGGHLERMEDGSNWDAYVHTGVRRLNFPTDTQKSLTCGFKRKKIYKYNWINQWRRSTCSAQDGG